LKLDSLPSLEEDKRHVVVLVGVTGSGKCWLSPFSNLRHSKNEKFTWLKKSCLITFVFVCFCSFVFHLYLYLYLCFGLGWVGFRQNTFCNKIERRRLESSHRQKLWLQI
jgi:hypothetical protein